MSKKFNAMMPEERLRYGDGNRGVNQSVGRRRRQSKIIKQYWETNPIARELHSQILLVCYCNPMLEAKVAIINKDIATPERNIKIREKLKGRIRPPLEIERASRSLQQYHSCHPDAMVGSKNSFYGKKHSAKTLTLLSEKRKHLWEDEEYRIKTMDSILVGRQASKPYDSHLELELAQSLTMAKIPFRYQVRIGVLNYDFEVGVDGSNLYVEIAGCYWHGCPKCCKKRMAWQLEGFKIIEVKENAFQNTLILWEHDIRDKGYDWCIAQIRGRITEGRKT